MVIAGLQAFIGWNSAVASEPSQLGFSIGWCAYTYLVADKSFAQPVRKKLQQPNSNFCKPLKIISEVCPSNQISAAAMTSASDEKRRPFNCFFFSRSGLRTYQHPCTYIHTYIHTYMAAGTFSRYCDYAKCWTVRGSISG